MKVEASIDREKCFKFWHWLIDLIWLRKESRITGVWN